MIKSTLQTPARPNKATTQGILATLGPLFNPQLSLFNPQLRPADGSPSTVPAPATEAAAGRRRRGAVNPKPRGQKTHQWEYISDGKGNDMMMIIYLFYLLFSI